MVATKRHYDVYGIGNALVDLQYKVLDTDLERLQLTKGGMKLVSEAEQKELLEYFSGCKVNQSSGGSAANSMIVLCQLGGRGAYGCVVGEDTLGRFYMEEMEVLGIRLHNKRLAGTPSGTCVVLITPDAERTMNTHLGATSQFSASNVSAELIEDSTWLYVEGYLFSSPEGQSAVRKAIMLAKDCGTKVAITFSDGFIVNTFRKHLEEAVASADLVFANLNESRAFTGAEEEDEVFKRLTKQVPNVVMTMSERGARVAYDGREYLVPSFSTKAIDDTGAGDIFAGAFLYAITHDQTARDAARLGCFLASKVVSQLGARLKVNVPDLVQEMPRV